MQINFCIPLLPFCSNLKSEKLSNIDAICITLEDHMHNQRNTLVSYKYEDSNL